MKLTVYAAPTAEPVSLVEARDQCSVDGSEHNATLTTLIQAGREYFETARGVTLVTTVYDLYLDSFPYVALPYSYPSVVGPWDAVGQTYQRTNPDGTSTEAIELPSPPVQSVTSVKYFDAANVLQTLSPTLYDADVKGLSPRICPSYNNAWPATYSKPNAVVVRYVAGYGTAADVPARIRVAIKSWVAHQFENREAVLTGTTVAPLPFSFESILAMSGKVRI